TVIVSHEPASMSVAENVPSPFVNCESGGITASGELSLVAKWTVPVYVGSTFPIASTALTVSESGSPAVGVVVEAVMTSFAVAASAWTVGIKTEIKAMRITGSIDRLSARAMADIERQ